MANLVKVTTVSELEEGRGRVFNVQGQQVGIFKLGDQVYGIQNICPHKGGPLGEGEVDGTVVSCPWHGWEFDLANGGVCTMNDKIAAKTYPVKREGDDIYVEV